MIPERTRSTNLLIFMLVYRNTWRRLSRGVDNWSRSSATGQCQNSGSSGRGKSVARIVKVRGISAGLCLPSGGSLRSRSQRIGGGEFLTKHNISRLWLVRICRRLGKLVEILGYVLRTIRPSRLEFTSPISRAFWPSPWTWPRPCSYQGPTCSTWPTTSPARGWMWVR